MTSSPPRSESWLSSLRIYAHPRVMAMLFLGFSSGLPLLLIFGTLSLWLREAGVDRAEVTYFSWAALGYSFKFVWAPLIDKLPLPWLSQKLGQRRGWLLLSQFAVVAAISLMAHSDPATPAGLSWMAVAAVMLGFSAATQDIVIDAYRIEAMDKDLQASMAATYIAGYRIGMLTSGAVALYLAVWFGSTGEAYAYAAWKWTYLCMAGAMSVGIITTLVIDEPVARRTSGYFHGAVDYARFVGLFAVFVAAFVGVFVLLSDAVAGLKALLTGEAGSHAALAGFIAEALRLAVALAVALAAVWTSVRLGLVSREMVRDTYVAPVADFFSRYHKVAVLILLLVGFYRVSDIVLGVISNVFYHDMGFSKEAIATVTKVFGIWMTILGGFLGGLLTMRYGVIRILMLGAVMTVLTNLAFILLAQAPGDLMLLYLVIGADNLTAGLASAAFVAYLSSLTSLSFTAMQYAIFSSLMTLFPKLLGGYSGQIVNAVGYTHFFLGASLIGVPVFLLVWLAGRHYRAAEEAPQHA